MMSNVYFFCGFWIAGLVTFEGFLFGVPKIDEIPSGIAEDPNLQNGVVEYS